jgi:cysteine desulfurase
MKNERVYLDHSATTPVREEVLQAMWPFFADAFGNPSSVHSDGGAPKEALARAHSMVADVLGCRPGEVVFTGGGTEADNLAVLGYARSQRHRGNHVITTVIEHEAVLNSCRQLEREGFRVTYLPVDRDGLVDPHGVQAALTDETVLVSVMLANNEIGTVQPVAEISEIAHQRGAVVHTDAVQAACLLDLNVNRLNVDLVSVSGHKVYGPKGVGALYVRHGIHLDPVIFGGGQEGNLRSGTENVPGVVGLAVALALAAAERDAEGHRLTELRDRLITGVLSSVSGAHLTGHPARRLPGHASFYCDDVSGESLLVNLDVAGISCSSGSACRAGSTEASHVLTAIGLPTSLGRNGLRMTLGRGTSAEDVDRVLAVLPGIVEEVRGGIAV